MSFADYARKKYGGQSSNEQSFTDYARGKYGTERGDAYAREQRQKEQISSALNSFVDGYKRRRAEEDAALEAARAAEKERKRQEELVKHGIKSAGSVSGSVSAIADAAETLERKLNPQRSTPENAARVMANKRSSAVQITPTGTLRQKAMPSNDTQRAASPMTTGTTGYRRDQRQDFAQYPKKAIAEAYDEPAEMTVSTAVQSPRTVDLDNLLSRGAYANNNRLQRDADKWLSTASNGAKRAAKQEGDEMLYIDGAAQAEYLRAKKAYDDYVAKYDRMQGPFLDGKGNLITNDDIKARKAELKSAMDAAMDAARAELRNALADEYKRLANRPDFKENLQNGYRREDQVLETATDGARFKSEEAQLIYNMTGAERRILTYLRNTQGEAAAKDYIAVLKPDLEKRVHSDIEKRSVELAEKHPGAAIVVRTLANLDNTIRGGSYTLKSAAAKLAGVDGAEIDPYSLSYTGGTARNAIQNNIGERLNKYFADNENVQKYLSNMGRNLGVKQLSSGKAPQFVFDTIMSGVVDSTAAGVIGGAFGSTAVGAALVSGSALVDTARDVKMQGGSDERALALGAVAGFLEYATEKMGFDRLADMITNGGRGGIRAVLSNMASEYAEEAGSEIGNYLAEWAADALDDVDMSTFRRTRQAYIDQGLSEAEATRRTWKDFALQVNEAGMGGALGGAIMGGGAQVVGKVFNAVAQREYNDAVDRAAEAGDAAAKAYRFNDNGLLRRSDYDSAFNTIWNGAADGLTLEQIEQAAPDIVGTLDEAQKQGIFDAAANAAQTAETVQTGNTSQSSEAKASAVQRPEIRTVQFDEAGNRTESTVFERKNTETAKQAQTERTETQPAREHTLEQRETTAETAAEPPVSRDQTKGGEIVDRTEETRQRGAETVSERVSEENRGEIEAYVTDQTKTAKGGVKRSYAAKKLTRQQKGQIRILDELGRHYGVEIEIVDSIEGGRANAVYEGGNRIKVALDAADQAYVQVGTHELVHYLKNRDEAGYRVVEKMVVDELSKADDFSLEDAILERRAEYAAQDVMIDDSAAMEEIVAEAIPSIWGDERAVRAFVSQNRSLAQKVRDFIVDFVDRLKQYAVDYAVDQDRTEILALQSREQDAVGTLEQIARTFDLALESAREKDENRTGKTERTETADEQAKPAQNLTNQAQHINLPDGVKYSIRRFDEQIQDVIDGKFPENDHVYVMETPEVLQSIGLKKLPMLMTQKHAYTTTMAEGKYRSTDVNYHALGLETMQKLPDAIANPLMVIKSHNYEGRITVITELSDKKGYSVIVPVIVEGHGVWQNVNVDTNMIASVYGRKNVIGDMKKAFANNEVLYLDKEKSDLIAQNLGVQFPDTMNEDRSSADIIADLTRAVKGENSENQQEISESSEENADQAQNEGETEAVESADGNDGAQADNASDGVRFSLKNESANKVDMDQTLRAGDNSVAGQTETQEQTRHTPVDVTDNMRQWADKRAGQIIREYRSTIDGESVREDIAKLVSELAEHGASSDALNATVNMAKGIIEKSSRLDSTLRDQYKDLRKNMRETAITLTDEQKQEAANITGSYGRYRQSLMGSVRLVSEGGTPLDTMWTEWSGQYPELFTPGLNEGDQVARLAEIKTMFEPKYVNEYGEHLDAAAADLGMRLYSEALKQVGDAARAQQVTQNLNGMRSRYSEATRQALKKVKSDQVARFRQIANELQAARQAGDRARQDELMKAYRADMKRAGMQQVEAEARSAYRAQFEDAAAWRKAHERTIKYARTLRQELAKPTKQKHIPAGLEKPVLDVLNCIDMSTTGRETQGTRQWRDSLESIAKWLDEQDRLQTNALDESQSASEGHEGVWMAICGRNIQDLRAAINIVSGTSGRVNQMSLAEMNALSNAMSIINHSVNSINQTWTLSRTESMNQLGDRSVSEMQKKRTNRAQDSKIPMLRELDTLLNVDQLDAVSFFERLGDVGGSVAESLTAGQSKAYERIREAADASREIFAIDGVDERQRREMIRGWRREQHTFTLTRGTTTQDVTMSGTQLMELYALSKREQARKHILSGGIRIAGQDGQLGDVYNYQVTQEQLDHMLGELTPEQKQVVDRMQAYLSGDVADWGNEVTMEMYLYKAFTEKTYWPIKSDTDYKRTKEQDGSVMYNALLNASWTKAVVDKPSNPITIGDAIETFAGHVSDMATYSGLAMPVDDLLKWYNYQSRDENGKADYNGSVKKEIRRTIGAVGTQYIQRLMDDLNGMGRRSYESDLISKAISNYKRAAIMAKLRVVIQQPTAILRASALIDPKYFSGMTRGIGKNAIAEMQEHSGLAWWKSNGNYEIGTGASMKSIITGMQDTAREAIGEKLGAPAGMADDLGWACIWQAVKRETEAEHPNMEVGSDAYWNIVRNRFEDVCIRTQVVDTVLTRSQLMRSKSQLMKSVTAFMSEPTKNYNLIRNALSAVYNAKTPDARKAAIGTLARSATAIAAAQALNAVVTAAHDMLKYYDPDDEDEDGEEITRIDMFADNWFSDMMDGINPLANIPIIKDVYALMMGEDVERMDLAVISDVIDAIKKLDNYVSGGNTRGLSAWGAVRPLLKAVGDMAGLPASGLIADTELLLNIVSPGVTRSIQRESNTSDAYTMLYRALAAGDAKKAASLRAKLKGGAFGKMPKSDKEIDAGVRDVLAISDDRIRQCFELKRQGGNTKELAALEKEIAADGFTMEQVVGAVNNYARLVGRTVRDNYKAAYLVKDEKQMKLYADQAKSLGYDDDDIAGWVAEKDLNEQLSGEMYTKDDMMSYIRKGTDGDIKDVVDYRVSVSGAEDPVQSVRNAIASEFKDEYLELIGGGKTGDAQKLKKRLLAAGLSEKTIDGWVYTNDGLKAYLLDGQGTKKQAQDILDYKVRTSGAKNPEDSAANALKSYRGEYIELARSDKKKAEAMAKRLIDLGLSESLIDTWNDAAEEEEE